MSTTTLRFQLMLVLCITVTCPENLMAVVTPTKKQSKTTQKTSKKVKREEKKEGGVVNTEQLLARRYAEITGFGIPKEDEELIVCKGGAPTYGEIEYLSLKTILDDLPSSVKKGVFYDYGSGVGKVCVQAYFDYPFKKVVGIELSGKRIGGAKRVLYDLKRLDLLDPKRKMEFIQCCFLECDTDDADVIYMCSTCYSNELMTKLVKKFSKFKKGLYVITLKDFSEEDTRAYGFEKVKEYKLPMSWSRDTGGSPVHVYKLTKKIKKAKPAKAESVEVKKEESKPVKKAVVTKEEKNK